MKVLLNKVVKLGIAKTKNEILRMRVLSFNKEYGIVKDRELETVAEKRTRTNEKEKSKNIFQKKKL